MVKLSALKAKALVAVPVVTGFISSALPVVAHAAEGDVATDVTGALDVFTKGVALFTQYPMNLFIGGSLLSMGLGIFGIAKRVARG